MIQVLEQPSIREMALPITVEQYHQLGAAGIIPQRTELLRGVILEKMTKSPLHVYLVQLLVKWLEAGIPAGQYVRKEEPITLADSEPEPDVAVIAGCASDHRTQHPTTAELIIEVAIATLELDRAKAAVYAAGGVNEYWIVIPEQRAVEVYTGPTPAGYQSRRRHTDLDAEIRLASFANLAIAPRRLFA